MTTSVMNIDKLKEICGSEYVKTDSEALLQYAVDGIVPQAVVFPKDTGQVSEIVKYAGRENLAIVPWGSGTKICAGHLPKRHDLVVCTSHLDHMKDVDSDNLTITVEAGVKFRDIQARLATEEDRCYLPLENIAEASDTIICSDRSHSGCFLPLDPSFSAQATIGGILASNSTGPRRLLYGTPRDLVLGTRFVAPDGQIIGTGGKTVKNVSGYDISKLMIGSAGSLGILCEMTLRLLPLPERMETLILAFDTFEKASAFVDRVFESKLLPAAVEVMNQPAFAAVRPQDSQTGMSDYLVAVALESFQEAVARMHHEMRDMAQSAGFQTKEVLTEDEHRIFWLNLGYLQVLCRNPYTAAIGVKLNYQFSAWKDIIKAVDTILDAYHMGHTVLCHAGSGVCLLNLLMDGSDADFSRNAVAAIGELLETACQANGNLVILEAPADLKPKLPIWGAMRQDLSAIKRIKNQLDPSAIMSPGRYVGGL